jgi:hypothetical protein
MAQPLLGVSGEREWVAYVEPKAVDGHGITRSWDVKMYVRAGLHACGTVIVSIQTERVVCKVAYWKRCIIYLHVKQLQKISSRRVCP